MLSEELYRQAMKFYKYHDLLGDIDNLFKMASMKKAIKEWYNVLINFRDTLIETLPASILPKEVTPYTIESFSDFVKKAFETETFVALPPIKDHKQDIAAASSLLYYFNGFNNSTVEKDILEIIVMALNRLLNDEFEEYYVNPTSEEDSKEIRKAREFYEKHNLLSLVNNLFEREDVKEILKKWFDVLSKYRKIMIDTLSSESFDEKEKLLEEYTIESFTQMVRERFEAGIFPQTQVNMSNADITLAWFSNLLNTNALDCIKQKSAILVKTVIDRYFKTCYADKFKLIDPNGDIFKNTLEDFGDSVIIQHSDMIMTEWNRFDSDTGTN